MRTINQITDRQVRNRLRKWRSLATEEQVKAGRVWYNEAEEVANSIAEVTGIDTFTAAAVIAALSPRNKWERNTHDAWELCKAWAKGEEQDSVTVCTFHANRDKAWRILEGEKDVLATSPKVSAFADTIVNGIMSQSIVVDVWHTRACIVTPNEGVVDCQASPTSAQYRRLEEITLEEANLLGEYPCEYQATVWCAIRDKWETQRRHGN